MFGEIGIDLALIYRQGKRRWVEIRRLVVNGYGDRDILVIGSEVEVSMR